MIIPRLNINASDGGKGLEYLQNIAFDQETYKYYDKGLYGKTGGLITNNQVPVLELNGIDDKVSFDTRWNAAKITFLVKFNDVSNRSAIISGAWSNNDGVIFIDSNGYVGTGNQATNNATTITLDDGQFHLITAIDNEDGTFDFIVDGIDRSGGNSTGWIERTHAEFGGISAALPCNCVLPYVAFYDSDGAIIDSYFLQQNSGTKVFSNNTSNHGAISGSGVHFNKYDNIPNYHQSVDLKRITHDNGVAYVNALINDAEIYSNYSNASIVWLSGLYKDDGSRLNLHASENENIFKYGADLIDEAWIKYNVNEVNNEFLFDAETKNGNLSNITDYTEGDVEIEFETLEEIQSTYKFRMIVDFAHNGSLYFDDEGEQLSKLGKHIITRKASEIIGNIFYLRLNENAGKLKISKPKIRNIITFSDELRAHNAPTAYQAGTDQANYAVNYIAGKVTKSMKLKA